MKAYPSKEEMVRITLGRIGERCRSLSDTNLFICSERIKSHIQQFLTHLNVDCAVRWRFTEWVRERGSSTPGQHVCGWAQMNWGRDESVHEVILFSTFTQKNVCFKQIVCQRDNTKEAFSHRSTVRMVVLLHRQQSKVFDLTCLLLFMAPGRIQMLSLLGSMGGWWFHFKYLIVGFLILKPAHRCIAVCYRDI